MKKVRVFAEREYDVLIAKNNLDSIGDYLLETLKPPKKLFVVTDENVGSKYLKTVLDSLNKSGYSTINAVLKAGESAKSIENFQKLLTIAANENLSREDAFVALGGGVIGDLCGFVAACFMRGVEYIQVPTTLLSAIDSSVGGKTAINLIEGKNLVGAFHQPSLTFFDISTLKTLPDEEMLCGIGEAIKYAILDGGEIFEILSQDLTDESLERLVYLCVDYKARIVMADEREKGLRKLLNLGHTIGHAIEKLSNYKTKHGNAVIMGLYEICKIQKKRGILPLDQFLRIESLLKKYGFNLEFDFKTEDIINIIKRDKKVKANQQIAMVLINKIGDCYIEDVEISWLKGIMK